MTLNSGSLESISKPGFMNLFQSVLTVGRSLTALSTVSATDLITTRF
jgi:hypothetical protein